MRSRCAPHVGSVATLLFASCAAQPSVAIQGDGVTVIVDFAPFALHVENSAGVEVLATLGGGDETAYGAPAWTVADPRFEPQLIPGGWDDYRANDGAWRRGTDVELLAQTDSSVRLRLGSEADALELAVSLGPRRARITVRCLDPVAHDPRGAHPKTGASFALGADEHFFGLGERYPEVDHRGLSLYNWAEEAGLGQGEATPAGPANPYPNGPSMTYFPVPLVLSSRGYAVHIATTYRSEVHLGSERPDGWRVAVDAGALPLTIYVDDDPLQILDDYTADTGRPVRPAPWVFGPRRRININAKVDGVLEWQLMRERGVPITGIDDSVHFLPRLAQAGREDQLRDWVETLHRNGFKVLCYNTPYVAKEIDAAVVDLAYGVDHGLFVKTRSGSPGESFFSSAGLDKMNTIDLTKPEAVVWFQDLLRRALDLGYDGWMHDFGEYIARDWVFDDGRRGDEGHNAFPVLSAKAAHDLMAEELPEDHLFFVRSGFSGTQAYAPAVWGGDSQASFDPVQGIPAALRAGLNLSMSGVPYWGSDIGGYKCFKDDPRDKEVFFRWAQLGAVSPIMMDQNACVSLGGSGDKWNLWRDAESTEQYAAMSRLHTRLQPYFLLLAERAHAHGEPITRHPFLVHPSLPAAWAVDDAFYLGPSLYVAPVVRRGARVEETWLPPGRFVDLDDYHVYAGEQVVKIPAPLAKLPLLLLADHLVPLLDASVQTLAPATEPGVVTANDVADQLDVIAALSRDGEACMDLVDGTRLCATRGAVGIQTPGMITVEAGALARCPKCTRVDPVGDVSRLRITSPRASTSDLVVDDVRVRVRGGPPRMVRWDILRLGDVPVQAVRGDDSPRP